MLQVGLAQVLPFIKAVCQSKKSWLARDTGIKIIQQIALLMGCGVLPYLKHLVEIIENGLIDDQQKVRTFTALAIAALAEAAYPYGIDAFAKVIKQLFEGIKLYKGKTLLAYFKATGCIIPLMDGDLAVKSTKLLIPVLKRDFNSPDDNTKNVILKVLKHCLISWKVLSSAAKSGRDSPASACTTPTVARSGKSRPFATVCVPIIISTPPFFTSS